MYFRDEPRVTFQGIVDSNGGMSVGAGIDDDDINSCGLLNPGDNFTFMIGLTEIQCAGASLREGQAAPVDISECIFAVDMRFPGTKQIQIRPVDDQS